MEDDVAFGADEATWDVQTSGGDGPVAFEEAGTSIPGLREMREVSQEWEQAGFSSGGSRVTVDLASGEEPTEPVTITVTRDEPVPEGFATGLRYFDVDAGDWVLVPTTVSADLRTLTAEVDHLSTWEDWLYDLGQTGEYITQRGTGARAGYPECSGSPNWALDGTQSEINDPVLYCYGSDPNDPEVLELRVVNNRGYAQWVVPQADHVWAYSSMFGLFDPQEVLIALANSVGAGGGFDPDGRILLPAGGSVHLGFTEDMARDAGTGPLVAIETDRESLSVGVVYEAVDAMAGDSAAAGWLALAAVAACGQSLVQAGSAADALVGLGQCTVANHELILEVATMAARAGGASALARNLAGVRNLWKYRFAAVGTAMMARDLVEWATQDKQRGQWDFTIGVLPSQASAPPEAETPPAPSVIDLTATDEAHFTPFAPEGGSVRCDMSPGGDDGGWAICEAVDVTWPPPAFEDCSANCDFVTSPPSCADQGSVWNGAQAWLDLNVTYLGGCAANQLSYDEAVTKSFPPGTSLSTEAMDCLVEADAITCTDRFNGQGFRMGRDGYELLNVVQ